MERCAEIEKPAENGGKSKEKETKARRKDAKALKVVGRVRGHGVKPIKQLLRASRFRARTQLSELFQMRREVKKAD